MRRIRPQTRERIEHTYSVIADYIGQHGYSPSFREISELADIPSYDSVRKYLRVLSREGKINFDPSTARSITLR